MTIRESTNKTEYDPAQIYPSAPFTQAFFYGEWQKNSGRQVRRFVILDNVEGKEKTVGFFQVVKFTLPFNKSFLYIPYGPVLFCDATTSLLSEVKKFLHDLAKKEKAVFVRTDFTVPERFRIEHHAFQKNFKRAQKHTFHSAQFQPRFEWYLNLNRSEDDILRDMHKNTRYSVRVAEKNNVSTHIIEENLSAHFEAFYNILKETSARDGFYLHPREYYENIFHECDKDKNAVLVLSSHAEKVLSANLIILYGDTGMFVFGGTSSEKRNVMPAYGAQFATIKYLKEKGYRWYNFGGVNNKIDEYHGWEGLTAFKKRFGGHIVHHDKFYDIVASPLWYFAYNLYKKFR